MKNKWPKSIISLFIGGLLLLPSNAITGIAADMPPVSVSHAEYRLTAAITASVKSVLNESTSEGARMAAVIRLNNVGKRSVRVPDYEVRLKTRDGIDYTLRASASNSKVILPKENVELSYLTVINRSGRFSLSRLSWVDVDDTVYPKREKTLLSVPVSSIEWKGPNTVITEPARIKKWGESFSIPPLSSTLEYQPFQVSMQTTPQGPVSLVTFVVRNTGDWKQAVPDFRVDGKVDRKVYSGKRVEQGVMMLEPGEQQYLHYAIPVGLATGLTSLNILTPENFKPNNESNVAYSVGRLKVELQTGAAGKWYMEQLNVYERSKPIRFDLLNNLIGSDVRVSMEALHLHESEEDGFKAVVAKFKLLNVGAHPKSVPQFQAELLSDDGNSYMGTRQTTSVQTLIPNVGYVIYYAFVVPSEENGDQLAINLLDSETAAPFNIPIAAYRTQIQPEADNDEMDFYPFRAVLTDRSLDKRGTLASDNSMQYTFTLKMNLDIRLQEKAVVEANFPKMKVELVNDAGKIIGSEMISFTGENRVLSGERSFSVSSPNDVSRFNAKIYEIIDTPFGEAKRLLKVLQ